MGDFPKDVIMAAETSQNKWWVPASVSLAQWALESNYGSAQPPGSNNPFGIKAVAGQPYVETNTHEVINGVSTPTTAKFAKFLDLNEAFDAHGKLLHTSHYYEKAMAARFNADDFANALTGVYATDPEYGSKLISLMKSHDLYAYNKLPDLAPGPAPVAAPPEQKSVPEPVKAAPVVTLPVPVTPAVSTPAAWLATLDQLIMQLNEAKVLITKLQGVNSTLNEILK